VPPDPLPHCAGLLLTTAFRHRINEPNIEMGFERFITVTGQPVTYETFCDAVAGSLRDGLIREPIRLPEGALQCHWHLELTPKGVTAARKMRRLYDNNQSKQVSCTLC
jgi:hypothetical protein